MKITAAMKKWLIENCDVKADAGDDEFRKAAGEALVDGKLSAEKLAELCKSPEDDEANGFERRINAIADGIEKLTKVISEKETTEAKDADKEKADAEAKQKEADKEKADAEKKEKVETKPSRMAKMIGAMGGTPTEPDEDDKTFDVRVKEAAESYGTERKGLAYPSTMKGGQPHPCAGRPVYDYDDGAKRPINEPSERDRAISGAFAKFLCATAQRGGSRTFGFQSLQQHDKELLCYALENEKWGGTGIDNKDDRFADIVNRKLTLMEQKALIDDSTSGGLEAAPIVFDDDVIQAPLLNGELFPLVKVVPLDRGRRIEGVSTGTVTGTWGGVDDSAIALFNTASYVSAFDTTIYRWEGAIRIGLDFLSDSPIDFGAHITAQYGERLLEDLDDVIAAGNGTTQPEGIINKTGITSVAFGATTTIGNYESLRFGVTKQEHGAAVKASAVFCGTETSYSRVRAIPVGTNDARRLGGMDYDSYSWMERPYKINASLSNQQIFYAILARYRMYRRRGLTIRTSTEGDTLIRRNELLMVAMARYGGQLERGATGAITSTAPA